MPHEALIEQIRHVRTVFNDVVKEMRDASRHERFFGASVDQLKTFGAELGEDRSGDDSLAETLSKKAETLQLKAQGTLAADRDLAMLRAAETASRELLETYQTALNHTTTPLSQSQLQTQFDSWTDAHERLRAMTAFRERAVG